MPSRSTLAKEGGSLGSTSGTCSNNSPYSGSTPRTLKWYTCNYIWEGSFINKYSGLLIASDIDLACLYSLEVIACKLCKFPVKGQMI